MCVKRPGVSRDGDENGTMNDVDGQYMCFRVDMNRKRIHVGTFARSLSVHSL